MPPGSTARAYAESIGRSPTASEAESMRRDLESAIEYARLALVETAVVGLDLTYDQRQELLRDTAALIHRYRSA